jgi:acid-sensing ion channel, other
MGSRRFDRSFDLISTNFYHQTNELFNNSTLHGVRYIAETGRTFGQRLMWFCSIIVGAVSALVIIASLWEKFQTNPTITGKSLKTFTNVLL